LPDTPNVIVALPCAGHGFKFADGIGKILADMTTAKTPSRNLGLFVLSRLTSR